MTEGKVVNQREAREGNRLPLIRIATPGQQNCAGFLSRFLQVDFAFLNGPGMNRAAFSAPQRDRSADQAPHRLERSDIHFLPGTGTDEKNLP